MRSFLDWEDWIMEQVELNREKERIWGEERYWGGVVEEIRSENMSYN